MDKLVHAYGEGRDSKDMFKIEPSTLEAQQEDVIQLKFTEIVESLMNKKVKILRKFNSNDDKLAVLIGQKYSKDEVIAQIDFALKILQEQSEI